MVWKKRGNNCQMSLEKMETNLFKNQNKTNPLSTLLNNGGYSLSLIEGTGKIIYQL